MKKLGAIFLSAVFLISFIGCDKLPGINGTTTLPPDTSPKGPAVARVGSWSMSVKEFEDQVQAIINLNNGESKVPVEALGLLARTFVSPYIETIDLSTKEGKEIYLDLLVSLELLAQEAERRGFQKDPEVAKSIRKSTVEILDLALLNNVLKDIKPTPLEVEEFYNKEYKQTLESIEQRKVREIVVNSKQKANDILVEIIRGGSFPTLATNHSVAESASKGGDLGYVIPQPNVKFPKFWDVVFTLDEGEESSIFKEPETNNYYIVKVEDVKKGEPESLSKVYNQLEFILTQKQSYEAIDDLINKIKSKTKVEVNPDRVM